jgi:hypothetical protein
VQPATAIITHANAPMEIQFARLKALIVDPSPVPTRTFDSRPIGPIWTSWACIQVSAEYPASLADPLEGSRLDLELEGVSGTAIVPATARPRKQVHRRGGSRG